MTGPEHIAKAEQLAFKSLDGEIGDEPYRMRLAAVAQVHATLALAIHTARLANAAEGDL